MFFECPKKRGNFALYCLMLVSLGLCSVEARAAANTPADCNNGLTLTAGTALSFGGIMDNDGGGGSVTIDPNGGAVTYSGVIAWPIGTPSPTPVPGDFSINVVQGGNCKFTQNIYTLPGSITLSDGFGHSMTISPVTTFPASGSTYSPSQTTLYVGGTLNVIDGQSPGTYSGTFDIYYAFQ
jgi:hypothetical protein